MVGLALNFVRDFPEATAQASQITLTLLVTRLVAPQIKFHLRVILARQLGLDGALEFGHHRLQLARFLLGQLAEVPFQIPGAIDAAGFKRRQQGITMSAPQGLKAGLDGGGARVSVIAASAALVSPTLRRLKRPSIRAPPAVMISSCRRWLSPPNTTMRP